MVRYLIRRMCFCCGIELGSCFGDIESEIDFHDPPSGGVCWHTRGNYGSTLIDSAPYEPSYEITICDQCLEANQDRITWYEEQHQRKITRVGTGFGREVREEHQEALRRCLENINEDLDEQFNSEDTGDPQ